MKIMRHILIYLYLPFTMSHGWAQDPQVTASLQRGAQVFMNYCSGCHSLKYLRYNRMAEDLGLTTFDGQIDQDLLKSNLIFTQATIYDPIQIAMPAEDAKQWFGVVPPDLSLSARERGGQWLYNYLNSFYNDSSRPFGVNNLFIPNVAMPNMLEPLIGNRKLVSNNKVHSSSLQIIKQGDLSPQQANEVLNDLVAFLVYAGEPAKLVRYQLGVYVVGFLCILLILVWLLRRVLYSQNNNIKTDQEVKHQNN